jgi:hypothetical protein
MGFYTTLFFLLLLLITLFLIDKGMLLFDPTPAVEWISIKSMDFSG